VGYLFPFYKIFMNILNLFALLMKFLVLPGLKTQFRSSENITIELYSEAV
jgi:hypothetical protein